MPERPRAPIIRVPLDGRARVGSVECQRQWIRRVDGPGERNLLIEVLPPLRPRAGGAEQKELRPQRVHFSRRKPAQRDLSAPRLKLETCPSHFARVEQERVQIGFQPRLIQLGVDAIECGPHTIAVGQPGEKAIEPRRVGIN